MKKQKLIILQGLPASGKTTYAKELVDKEGYKRVNKDDLRAMIDNGKWSKENESEIIRQRDMLICRFLEMGYNVVVDDTNFHPDHIKTFNCIANKYREVGGSELELEIKFIDTPLYECIERDAKRPNPVGSKVIMRMYNQYLSKPPIDNRDESLPTCIICDVDGTLAYMNGRTPFEYNKVLSDVQNQNLIDLLTFVPQRNIPIFIVSGRKSECRKETEEWLYKYNVPYKELYMREDNDDRDDTITKKEIYEKYIKGKYNILCVIDDRPKMISMWKEQGLFTLDANRQDSRINF